MLRLAYQAAPSSRVVPTRPIPLLNGPNIRRFERRVRRARSPDEPRRPTIHRALRPHHPGLQVPGRSLRVDRHRACTHAGGRAAPHPPRDRQPPADPHPRDAVRQGNDSRRLQTGKAGPRRARCEAVQPLSPGDRLRLPDRAPDDARTSFASVAGDGPAGRTCTSSPPINCRTRFASTSTRSDPTSKPQALRQRNSRNGCGATRSLCTCAASGDP